MIKSLTYVLILIFAIFFSACSSKEPPSPKAENFLTLADLSGKISLKENSPDEKVIRVKSKYFIKRNDIRAAKSKCIEIAQSIAVEEMVKELLTPEVYNNKFDIIEEYVKNNVSKYVIKSEVNEEKKIFGGEY